MKKTFIGGLITVMIAAMVVMTVQAAIDREMQDFEGLNQAAGDSLSNEGWLVFANVFSAGGFYLYGYGPFPAPNGGPGFSGIDIGQGGLEQGDQQLVVYSDYNNGDHAGGALIEANVFQERRISSIDLGETFTFQFDAKRGNINENPTLPAATAAAFIKILDPNNGFSTTTLLTVDTTAIPDVWGTYSIDIFMDPALQGQIVQWGFTNTSTNYQGTGVFYDNVSFKAQAADDDCSSGSSASSGSASSGSVANAAESVISNTQIEFGLGSGDTGSDLQPFNGADADELDRERATDKRKPLKRR